MKSTVQAQALGLMLVFFLTFIQNAKTASSQDDNLILRATIRSFTPSKCLDPLVYAKLWGNRNTRYRQGYLSVQEWKTSVSSGQASSKPVYYTGNIFIDFDKLCLYWHDISDGLISGHPDFDVFKGDIESCSSIDCVPNLTLTKLAQDTSGLDLPQFCQPDICDAAANTETLPWLSNSTYFDMWFHDNPKFNKRLAIPLTLKKNAKTGSFEYNSEKFLPVNEKFGDRPYRPTVDVNKVPFWPDPFFGHIGLNASYWFTTEIHTSFEYLGGEELRFSGNDDFWLFIDGKEVINLAGISQKDSKIVEVDSLSTTLGLQKNKIYSLDIFHANRQFFESFFSISIKLTKGCNVAYGDGKSVFDLETSDSSDLVFDSISSFGSGKTIKLTEIESTGLSSSSAWIAAPQNIIDGFSFVFDLRINSGIPEGLALVFQNDPRGIKGLPMSLGSGLGFAGIEQSLTIAIDTCVNRDKTTNVTGDCNEQKISVYKAGSADEHGKMNMQQVVHEQIFRSLVYPMETHTVEVVYLKASHWLEVYVNDSLYLRVKDMVLEEILGNRYAHVGFTSALSSKPSETLITRAKLTTISIDFDKSLYVNYSSIKVPLLLGGIYKCVFGLIKAFDSCGSALTYGNLSVKGKVVIIEIPTLNADGLITYQNGKLKPQIETGDFKDNENGTYSLLFKTDMPGTYEAYWCFEDSGCDYSIVFKQSTLPNAASGLQNAIIDSDSTFQKTIPLVLRSLPEPTITPTSMPPTSNISGDGKGNLAFIAGVAGGSVGAVALVAIFIVFCMRYRKKRDSNWNGKDSTVDGGSVYEDSKRDVIANIYAAYQVSQSEILRLELEKHIEKNSVTNEGK